MWVKRLPDEFRDRLYKTGHTTDTHVAREIFAFAGSFVSLGYCF